MASLTLATLAVSAVLASVTATAPETTPRTATQPAPPARTVTQPAPPARTVTKTVTTPAQTVTTPSRTATVTQKTATSVRPTVTVATTGADSDGDGSVPWWVWLLIALGVAGVAVGIVLIRRSDPPDDTLPPPA